jgi:hypothetical protein
MAQGTVEVTQSISMLKFSHLQVLLRLLVTLFRPATKAAADTPPPNPFNYRYINALITGAKQTVVEPHRHGGEQRTNFSIFLWLKQYSLLYQLCYIRLWPLSCLSWGGVI